MSKPSFDEIALVQKGLPNHKETVHLINEIKGARTLRQLSNESDIALATLSRIINGHYTRPLSMKNIKKLSVCSEDPKTMEELLLRANGFCTVEERLKSLDFNGLQRMSRKQRKDMFTDILTYLFEQGYTFRKIPDDKQEQFEIRSKPDVPGVCLFKDLGISVFLPEQNLTWYFIPILYDHKEKEADIETFIGLLIKEYALLFFLENQLPETFKNIKFTFCFLDKVCCKQFSCILARTKRVHFSTMIIENGTVEEIDLSSISQSDFDEFDKLNIVLNYED